MQKGKKNKGYFILSSPYLNLFHNYSVTTTDMNIELEKAKKGFLNQQFSILLSFEIEGTTNDYIFNFNVNDIQLISRY